MFKLNNFLGGLHWWQWSSKIGLQPSSCSTTYRNVTHIHWEVWTSSWSFYFIM